MSEDGKKVSALILKGHEKKCPTIVVSFVNVSSKRNQSL